MHKKCYSLHTYLENTKRLTIWNGTDRIQLRASPTVLHIAFAFFIFVKIHKNISSTILHIGFAFLKTWQILGETVRDVRFGKLVPNMQNCFGKWQVRFAKLLEISYFSPFHLLSRVSKLQQMAKKKCQTVGYAQRKK
jgi:hypothetical protein